MPHFVFDGIQFHYREAGAGVPFVFQHGLGADTSQTFEVFQPPPGVRLITMDCRGHGETDPVGPEEKLSIPQFAKDVCALMDTLGLEKAVVGGISMGAQTALHLALTRPERVLALVLSRPAWLEEARTEDFQVFLEIARLIRRYGAFEGARRFASTPEFERVRRASPDNAKSLLGQFAHPRAEATVAKLERIPRHEPQFRRADWGRIAVPTLVLANREDVIHPFAYGEALAAAIPGAVLQELTPKSQSKERHVEDTRRSITGFLAGCRL